MKTRDFDTRNPFRRKHSIFDLFDEFFPQGDFEFQEPEEFEEIRSMGKIREPLVDIVDKGDELELTAELPGVEKNDITIHVEETSITIGGKQAMSLSEEDKKRGHFYQERSYQSFYRRFPLPAKVIASKASAEYNNGILIVKLPKKEAKPSEPKGFKLEVK